MSASVTVVDAGPRKVARAVEVDRPATELFALVADPHRHRELDGSGTVRDTVSGPHELSTGDRFSVKMRMFGLPYRITSKVTELTPDRVIEWRHPLGHHWRWEFEPLSDTRTRVVETFDYSGIPGAQAKGLEVTDFPGKNARGIEATLTKLAAR